MTHTYYVEGMTCSNCAAKIKSELLKLADVEAAGVSEKNNEAVITMSRHIPLAELQQAVSRAGKYSIAEKGNHGVEMQAASTQSWIITYKPILVIFAYIVLISSVIVYAYGLTPADWMNFFMAQFFLVFSFFKMLDLKGFAEGYSTYDLLAKKWKPYGFIYPFIELIFGISLLIGASHHLLYVLIAVVMGFSLLGVINSLRKKQVIECACLGTIFKIPLGTVTLIEDALMAVMSVSFLFLN